MGHSSIKVTLDRYGHLFPELDEAIAVGFGNRLAAAASEEEAALDLAQLGLAEPESLDAAVSMRAGLLRARHYHGRARAVSLGDCVVAETARRESAPVASSDPHLLDMCRQEGLDVFPLPDGRGVTWRG